MTACPDWLHFKLVHFSMQLKSFVMGCEAKHQELSDGVAGGEATHQALCDGPGVGLGWGHVVCSKSTGTSTHFQPHPLFQLAGNSKKPTPPQAPRSLDLLRASARSDMIAWSRVLLSHTLDAARSY